jgi:hypothetical protein
MSASDEPLPPVHSLDLNDGPLFPQALGQQSGTLEHRLPDGTTIRAQIENGHIVGYTAHDAYGRPRPVRRLRLTDGRPHTASASPGVLREECYFCMCDDSGQDCQCWPENCPDPPDIRL